MIQEQYNDLHLSSLCGKCSQKQGVQLNKRIELALSRVKGQVLNCPVCKKNHFLK